MKAGGNTNRRDSDWQSLAAPMAAALLGWYDRAGRDLPWRERRGRPDPYRVWLSEIMLQQTTVAAVIPYFEKFTRAWPTVAALAAAPLDDVLAAWAGLGYYARARNLHACARAVAEEHGGALPDDEEVLRALPGIGPYTAAAIAAIAFGRPAVVVDGNVERVVARLAAIEVPLPEAKPAIRDIAAALAPATAAERPGDFAQGLMDLGATVCTPRNPDCEACPWRRWCRAAQAGVAARYPLRAAKRPKPERHGTAFWLECDGQVYLTRRPPKGLLGGMLEVPSSDWEEEPKAASVPPELNGTRWRELPGVVRHTFTHFHLELRVQKAELAARPEGLEEGGWYLLSGLDEAGLPSLMMKVARHAMAD